MNSYTTVKTYTILKKEKVIDFLSLFQDSATMKFLIFACLLAVALAKQVSVVRKSEEWASYTDWKENVLFWTRSQRYISLVL